MDIYYIDDQFVPANKASIPVNDLALLRGYGVFDLIRTYTGSPLLLKEHLHRLERSACEIGLSLPWSQEELTQIVLQTLEKNNHVESNIRIIVTGGPSIDFITPQGHPRLLVLVTPVPTLPEWWFTRGIKAITVFVERSLPMAKSINYLPATIALNEARSKGAVEAVYIDRNGYIREGATSNLFAFFGDQLVTPGEKILPGITRQFVLRITEEIFDSEIREISKEELLTADEVFITGSGKGIVPVVQVDDATIGSGKPGQRTLRIIKCLKEYTEKNHQRVVDSE